MALPIQDQAKYWGLAALVFCLVLWFLGNVMLPFLVGGAIAYFLDPLVNRLQRLGMGRVAAVATISFGMLLIAVLLILAVIPTLVSQLTALIEAAPDIFRQLQSSVTARFPELTDQTSTVRQTFVAIGDTIRERGGEVVNTLIASAFGVINAIVFIVVVPVVSFYLLLDWDSMVARVDSWLPRDHAPTIRQLAREIDRVLAGFVRGQLTVCLVLGTFYAVGLMLAGLQFGLIVGAIAGAITFIPYIGALLGGVLAIGLALFQFWGDWVSVGIVAGIFALGQFLEGNIVTPRLMGNSVGLHPVWLLFALSAFGSIFGFVGLLVAVPIAAMIGVLIRFAIGQYKTSMLYQGKHSPFDPGEDV